MDVNFQIENVKINQSLNQLNEADNFEIDSVGHQLNSLVITDKEFLEQLDNGNIQYNLDLSKKNKIDWDKLINQLAFRLEEGNGECFYELGLGERGEKLGLSEEDLKESVENLEGMAMKLDASIQILKFYRGKLGLIGEIVIRKNSFLNKNLKRNKNYDSYEIKIGLFGEESSGKSTLIGVLVNGCLDNGEGSARQNIFRFPHEMQCGKTFSISHQIVGFDQNENILNSLNWDEIMQKSSKIISFYDLGGSEKAAKTTLGVLSPNYLDYFFLVTSAKQGITDNTKLFLIIANSMNLPIISLITMSDLVNQYDLEELIKNYKFLIKTLKLKKMPILIKSFEDISLFSRNLNENIHPILIMSNKSGIGFEYLVNLLKLLPTQSSVQCLSTGDNFCQFDIHEHFLVEEKDSLSKDTGKLIVGGIVSRGKIFLGQKYYLGPDKAGNFKIVEVADIHCKKISVKIAYEGQFSSLSLIKPDTFIGLKYEDVRKGMSLLDVNSSQPIACKSFQAEVWSLDGNAKIVKYKYEPVVNIKHIRQTCKIKRVLVESVNKNCDKYEKFQDEEFEEDENPKIRQRKKASDKGGNNTEESYTISPDEKILLNFEFKNYPEFITTGSHIIINDSHLKAFGVVTKVLK